MKKHGAAITFLFMFRLKLPLRYLGLVNLPSIKTVDHALCPMRFNSTTEMISASLASLPLHNTKTPISLFLSLSDSLSVPLSPTHIRAQRLGQTIHRMLYLSISHGHFSTKCTHTIDRHTHDGHTHEHKQKEREKKRDPKHQNSINPLRRSLKGFLKADFHHTEAFQVSTVCGGNGAEAFKLYALTFPLCYFLFLHFSCTVFLFSLSYLYSYSLYVSLHFFSRCHFSWKHGLPIHEF